MLKFPFTTALSGLILFGLASIQTVFAQPGDELEALRKEVQTLKENQLSMQKDLQEIKAFLQSRQPSPSEAVEKVVSIANNPVKGDANAKLTLIEFSDYQCPFCLRHFRTTFPQLEKDYIQTGKLKYVFRDYPLEAIHKSAFKAAEAAHCAGEQGKYWEMHDQVFTNQQALAQENWVGYAEALGLEMPKFRECLDSGKYAAAIRQDIKDGEEAQVRGTPTFFLGIKEGDGNQVKVVRVIRGAQPYQVFKQEIDALLAPKS